MRWQAKYNWYLLDMSLFTAFNILMIYLLHRSNTLFWPIDLLSLFVLGLAAWRGANMIANEEITKSVRAPFVDVVEKNGKSVEQPKPYGWRGAMGSLIYCSSCTGVWVAAILVYSHAFFPVTVSIIALILTLSAGERFFTIIFDVLKKRT